MVERKVLESVGYKTATGGRSPLLMPIMEGHTLESGDVAEFLKSRLSYLRQKTSHLPRVKLS